MGRAARFPWFGWLGLAVWVAAGSLLWVGVEIVRVFLTPIVWTGYILAVDGAVFSLRGRSLLTTDRGAFGWMAAVSIPLWLVFEAYNLRLENWRYVGLPESGGVRLVGYLWSFATITPAVLETAEWVMAVRGWSPGAKKRMGVGWSWAGAAMLVVPLIVPAEARAYLFGLVWLGFVPLLEPWNQRFGRGGVFDPKRAAALCISGVVCGFVWEFWNYWAQARWVYVFPIWQEYKLFEMPLPGYLGFPAFALEVFVMYGFVTWILKLPYYEVR